MEREPAFTARGAIETLGSEEMPSGNANRYALRVARAAIDGMEGRDVVALVSKWRAAAYCARCPPPPRPRCDVCEARNMCASELEMALERLTSSYRRAVQS